MSTARTKGSGTPPAWLTPALGGCVAIGVAAFVYGLFGAGEALLGWQAIHIGYLYILGPTFAGVLISAIWELTSSKWGQNIKRFSEASIGVLPVVLIGYIGLAAAHHHVMHAGHHGHELIGGRNVWLEPTFLLVRDALALLALTVISLVFIKHQLRPSLGAAIKRGAPLKENPLAKWITSGYSDYSRELARSTRIRQILAPILVFVYALVLTLFAFDHIMALDPLWISTLFGAYYFITSLFMAWAFLAIMTVLHRRIAGAPSIHGAAGRRISTDNLHDLSKLLFAFCMLSADFFWSQFVVIWYANIPEVTPFVIRRVRLEPWNDLALTVLILGYAVPFVLLLFKRLKRTDVVVASITALVLIIMVFERTLLVAPTLWHDSEGQGLPFAQTLLLTFGVTLGFIGAAGFGYRYVLGVFIHAPPEKDLSDAGELIEDSGVHHHGQAPQAEAAAESEAAGEAAGEAAAESEAADDSADDTGEADEADDDERDDDEADDDEADEADADEKERPRRRGEEGDDE